MFSSSCFPLAVHSCYLHVNSMKPDFHWWNRTRSEHVCKVLTCYVT